MEMPDDLPTELKKQFEAEEQELSRVLAAETHNSAPDKTTDDQSETTETQQSDTQMESAKETDDTGPTPAQGPETTPPVRPESTEAPDSDQTDETAGRDAEIEAMRQENARIRAALKTLQGKIYAEVPRMHQILKEREAQIEELRKQIGRPDETKDAVNEFIEEFMKRLPDEQREVPPEWLAVSLRAASEFMNRSRQEQGRKTQPTPQVTSQQQDFDEQRYLAFWQRLKSSVPDLETVNQDPEFMQWLSQTDPMLGQPRIMFLKDAEAQYDDAAAAAWFDAYKRETGKNADTDRTQDKKDAIRKQVTARPAATHTKSGSAAKQWSQDELDALAVEVSKGRFPEAEFRKIEQQALQEMFSR